MRDILLQILTDVGYRGDREQYADSLLKIAHAQTFKHFFDKLPQVKKDQLKNSNRDIEAVKLFLEENFSREEYDNTFTQILCETIDSYLKEIAPHLSDEKIQKLLQSFAPQNI